MAISLSNLVDNLAEKNQKIKCKDCDCFLEYKSAKNLAEEFHKIKCEDCDCFLEYESVKDKFDKI